METSSRRGVGELPSSRPFITTLPALYQEDEFTARLLSGFDQVLAPVENVLDCLTAYLDPRTAPDDFVRWLGGWLGAVLDEDMTIDQQRTLVGSIAEIYAMQGTVSGLQQLLELSLPVRVEVVEGGEVTYSIIPGQPLPGTKSEAFLVRIGPASGTALTPHQQRLCEVLITANRPAHLPAVIEFLEK
jgi:phage tail-like protein